MRLARVLGAIGRGLISAGVIVLLFVGYQLWGTSLQHNQAQGDLNNELEEAASIAGASEVVVPEDATEEDFAAAAAATQAEVAEAVAEAEVAAEVDAGPDQAVHFNQDLTEDEQQEFISTLYPDPGDAFARIVIPSIGVDEITVEGVSVEDLRKGPGHYQTTPNPGQAGNAAIAGHRTTYGAPFHRVDELRPGASIFVTTVQGTFEYRVQEQELPTGEQVGYFIVSPSATEVLNPTGENVLTLTACHPKYSARQRIIVRAKLVGEPAPTLPRDEAQDLAPVDLSSGAADEEQQQQNDVTGILTERAAELGEDVVMSDEVAADDDPTVDAEGNPLEGVSGDVAGDATDEVADEAEAADAEETEGDEQGLVDESAESDDDIDLASAQTPFSDDQDFGEGLNGDPTKVRPAIMWGLAGGSIWLAAWFIGQRVNRKWTLYFIGLAPFALVLWSTFVNIDQALPSY